MNIESYIITGVNLVLLLGGILYVSRKGTPDAASEVIKIFQARDEEQKKIIDELRAEVKENGLALAKLQGVVSEKDKKLQEYVDIFRGRSPEQEQFMKEVRAFNQEVEHYMKNNDDVLAGIKLILRTTDTKTSPVPPFVSSTETVQTNI